MPANVTKNYIKYNGYRYYKARAQSIELGDFGRKKTPINRANYLDQKGQVNNLIESVSVSRFSLKQTKVDKVKLLGNFSMAIFSLKGDDFFRQAKSGVWEFVEIHIRNEIKFLKRLNARRGRIETLKAYDDYRIVDSIIVVMKATEVRKMAMGHSGNFTGGWNGMKLSVKSKTDSKRTSTFEIDPDTCYAYGLKKLKWDSKNKKKRTKIIDMVDDPHGL